MATVLHITPARVIASNGKFDSNYRYVRASPAPQFFFATGRTCDVANGGLRYGGPAGDRYDDSNYNGSWTAPAGIGCRI
ncbi:MAG TPA: hypothetical protein VD978_12130 [Azospirillum sp.]|nr:hypothetical protein [Azospirillum sp.]